MLGKIRKFLKQNSFSILWNFLLHIMKFIPKKTWSRKKKHFFPTMPGWLSAVRHIFCETAVFPPFLPEWLVGELGQIFRWETLFNFQIVSLFVKLCLFSLCIFCEIVVFPPSKLENLVKYSGGTLPTSLGFHAIPVICNRRFF